MALGPSGVKHRHAPEKMIALVSRLRNSRKMEMIARLIPATMGLWDFLLAIGASVRLISS
jgi:hypothetical protein